MQGERLLMVWERTLKHPEHQDGSALCKILEWSNLKVSNFREHGKAYKAKINNKGFSPLGLL